MALKKCPRCELNYILDGGELCTVCRREVRGEPETLEIPEMCSECGERPAIPGGELCIFCLKDMNRRSNASAGDDTLLSPEDAAIGIDSVSTMDEIELDVGSDDMADEFDSDDEFENEDKDDEEENGNVLSIDALAEDEYTDDEEEE